MNITPAELNEEYEKAREKWQNPIHGAAVKHHLPRFLIWAVGSRETNLTDETGDDGHGRGIFQLDDRSHTIPDPFPVELQADIAGNMLHGLILQFAGEKNDPLGCAVAAYNCGAGNVTRALRSGHGPDYYTTGRDYSADVIARMMCLREMHPEHADTRDAVDLTAPNGGEGAAVPSVPEPAPTPEATSPASSPEAGTGEPDPKDAVSGSSTSDASSGASTPTVIDAATGLPVTSPVSNDTEEG